MTFETLLGRLERLKRLAEMVDAERYESALSDILGDLEPPRDGEEEVDTKLLMDLRQRIGGSSNMPLR